MPDLHCVSFQAQLELVPQYVVVGDAPLTIQAVIQVSRQNAPVHLTQNRLVWQRVQDSCRYVAAVVTSDKPVYGITTGFGGMADQRIASTEAAELQQNMLWFLKAGMGKRLPNAVIRAAMLIRLNCHLLGASGIRQELIERMQCFLNEMVTPHVYELGSIGASGDLVPLAYIAGALIGLDPSCKVDFKGETMAATEVLKQLKLPCLKLQAKEGLAITNGTSVMTAIAVHCAYDAEILLTLAMGAHALLIQALGGTNQSFHPFIHQHKPHSGQIWSAAEMLRLLAGSRLSRDEVDGQQESGARELIQDRYSLRCLPQYLGPIVEGLKTIIAQIEVEINSATDNPLIDAENFTSYHGGNFLGQYIGVGMDQLRYYLGLLAKHLDTQIALLVAPEFNNGLSPSLVGNSERKVNMGLKGLQIVGNSIMPLISFYGNSLVDRFPTHAEQFNQNINSQGFGSANLARQSIELLQQYMAVALMVGVQAVDLKTYQLEGHYDACRSLSPLSATLYKAVRAVVDKPIQAERPYIWDDSDQSLDFHLSAITRDIRTGGHIPQAMHQSLSSLQNFLQT